MQDYEIVEYQETAAAIAILREKHSGPFDVGTKDGMALAKDARAEVRGYRTAVERMRVELKAPLLEKGKAIDAEAKRITAELIEIEEPINRAIKAEEDRKEHERQEKARAEAARVAELRSRVDAIRHGLNEVTGKSAEAIRVAMQWAETYQPDPGEFMEFLPDAIAARNEVREILKKMLADRERAEAEREELERLRAQVTDLLSGKVQPAVVAPTPTAVAPTTPANGAKASNGRGKKAAPTPLEKLVADVRAGNCRFEDAIGMAYKLGYDDGVAAHSAGK